MFGSGSRYAQCDTYQVTLATGQRVSVVEPPPPVRAPIGGYYPRRAGDRLDLIAAQYLNAPTGFWRLCDANNAMVAGALAARALIGIPQGGAP